MNTADFEHNVFVNCPFDEDYLPLLRPLLFTVLALGFEPRIASERSDSAENRLDKICGLIRYSRYSIHDLSRLRAATIGEYYRMNMPFELGVDYGCRSFGRSPLQLKRFLVLEKDSHEFQKALSDLSGVDIKSHGNQPRRVVQAVRNWFVDTAGVRTPPAPTALWYRFTDFASDFYDSRKADGFSGDDLNMMPTLEYVDSIRGWLKANA